MEKRTKTCSAGMRCSRWCFSVFRERVSDFSLSFWAIRLLEFAGTRRKAVLRSEGFVWVPVLRSFDKLHEIEVLSYLSYTLFKCFVMFRLV